MINLAFVCREKGGVQYGTQSVFVSLPLKEWRIKRKQHAVLEIVSLFHKPYKCAYVLQRIFGCCFSQVTTQLLNVFVCQRHGFFLPFFARVFIHSKSFCLLECLIRLLLQFLFVKLIFMQREKTLFQKQKKWRANKTMKSIWSATIWPYV